MALFLVLSSDFPYHNGVISVNSNDCIRQVTKCHNSHSNLITKLLKTECSRKWSGRQCGTNPNNQKAPQQDTSNHIYRASYLDQSGILASFLFMPLHEMVGGHIEFTLSLCVYVLAVFSFVFSRIGLAHNFSLHSRI